MVLEHGLVLKSYSTMVAPDSSTPDLLVDNSVVTIQFCLCIKLLEAYWTSLERLLFMHSPHVTLESMGVLEHLAAHRT